MTTYSKLCPKCQHSCDLAAPSCKRCGLRFGAPAKEASGAGKQAQPSTSGRGLIVLAVVGLLLIVLAMQVFGSAQERARRKQEVDNNSWDAIVRRQHSGGK